MRLHIGMLYAEEKRLKLLEVMDLPLLVLVKWQEKAPEIARHLAIGCDDLKCMDGSITAKNLYNVAALPVCVESADLCLSLVLQRTSRVQMMTVMKLP